MFEELKKYKGRGSFLFKPTQDLKEVCNAPVNRSGIYLVYAIFKSDIELVYVGRSGKMGKDGKMFIRKAGIGGMKDRIVNGHQFGKIPRRISWPHRMKQENIDLLDIHWYVTHDDLYNNCPRVEENNLLKKHVDIYKQLPKWNKEL